MRSAEIIIVAGGSGSRMGGAVPKQFMELCGKPVLMRSIERFAAHEWVRKIIVVLPASEKERWSEIVNKYDFQYPHTVVTGGETRFHSVKNALAEVSDCEYIGIHDGVRPLVTSDVIERVFSSAIGNGGAIPVMEVNDSLREITGKGSIIVDRSRFRSVQTPQFFRTDMLFRVYEADYDTGFTDDSSVFEAAGHRVALVEGDARNLKITNPVDMAVARAILENDKCEYL